MRSHYNVRVELKPVHPNATDEQKVRAFRGMLSAFKRRVNESGILSEINQRAAFESRGQKRRRKMKESEIARRKEAHLQTRLREHFGQG